jgi:hypothetical protein
VLGGHTISGFASRDDRAVRVLLYAQDPADTQSRSQADFNVALDLGGMARGSARIREYRFDKDHNSFYRRAVALRNLPESPDPAKATALSAALRDLETPELRPAALKTLEELGPAAEPALPSLLKLIVETKDESLQALVRSVVERVATTPAFPREDVEQVRDLSVLRVTSTTTRQVDVDGHLKISALVAGNGVSLLVIEPNAP